MILLIVALGIVISSLFSIPWAAWVGQFWPPFGSGIVSNVVGLVLNFAPALAIAYWALSRLDIVVAARDLTGGKRLIVFGLISYVVYWLLAFSGVLLSAVPYGGGTVPAFIVALQLVPKALLVAGLWKALLYELPATKLGSQDTRPLGDAA